MSEQQYLSVSALTRYIKAKFDRDPYMEKVFLTGEISNFRKRPTHQYFSLKDENAVIQATMWARDFQMVGFELEEGMKVLVVGRVSVYEKSGSYQIIIEQIEPDGVGALYQRFRQLQEKLYKEGLFNPNLKQVLPRFPMRIAVLTSPSGAVIRDIMTTVKRRYPIAQIVLFPTIVQGNGSAGSIVANIRKAEELADFDVMIIGRGGGSIEDLWSFNEEEVVRAIFEARTPIISSVGHETDVTLADMVADVRAATPTAAAELATPELSAELYNLGLQQSRLIKAFSNNVALKKQRLIRVQSSYIFEQPWRMYEGISQRLDKTIERLRFLSPLTSIEKMQVRTLTAQTHLIERMNKQMDLTKAKTRTMIDALDLLSPLKILSRGFSYTTKEEKMIKSVEQVVVNDDITVHLADGLVQAKIREVKKNAEN